MDLTPYVDNLRQELAVAAAAGGDEARALAERLTAPLESAARLTLLNALSAAMDEVARDLAPGSVDVRLRGLNPTFVVTPPPALEPYGAVPHTATAPPAPPLAADGEEGGTARINLRLPAHLKARAEEAANQEGLSVNAWLVRVLAAALEPGEREGPSGLKRNRTGESFTGRKAGPHP
ncbi:toxin-antitoxin system HicB family antitoxin [Streptomyces sp. NPDC048258]|uniref:toxin-antitoxin system HicB family antitoxin n=1 Tax=Streptomyces sp. NPDC048258 TaxID=3365527 RepID=UPI003718FD14